VTRREMETKIASLESDNSEMAKALRLIKEINPDFVACPDRAMAWAKSLGEAQGLAILGLSWVPRTQEASNVR